MYQSIVHHAVHSLSLSRCNIAHCLITYHNFQHRFISHQLFLSHMQRSHFIPCLLISLSNVHRPIKFLSFKLCLSSHLSSLLLWYPSYSSLIFLFSRTFRIWVQGPVRVGPTSRYRWRMQNWKVLQWRWDEVRWRVLGQTSGVRTYSPQSTYGNKTGVQSRCSERYSATRCWVPALWSAVHSEPLFILMETASFSSLMWRLILLHLD